MYLSRRGVHVINLLLAAGSIVLLTSCASTRTQKVEHTIRNESSINQATEREDVEIRLDDTPIIEGAPTYPVLQMQDSSGIEIGDLRQPITTYEVRVGEGKVEVVQDSTKSIFKTPAEGEVLTIFSADTVGSELSAVLTGEVVDEVIEVIVPVRRSFWQEIRSLVQWLVGLAGVLAILYFTYIYVQARKSRAVIEGTSKVASNVLESFLKRKS